MPDTTTQKLDELLDDPVMAAVMDRDGVSRDDLWSLLATMKNRLQTPDRYIAG